VSDELDLDAKIDALRRAVDDGDREAITRGLAVIERELESMNPLLRGMTYAHVKSVLGRPREAVAVVEDLLELMPEDGRVHYQLGCYRRAAEDADGALAAFTRATELDASLVDAWVHRGMLLDARGEAQRAVEAYRHAMLRAPTEPDVWRNLGNSLAAMGCFDEAVEAYRTALGLRPGDETLMFLVASVHKARGELARANEGLSEAMREQLGRVVEVEAEGGGLELRCRFHVPGAREQVYRESARELLAVVLRELEGVEVDADALPMAREDSFVIRHLGVVLVCDVDPVRPGLPHRFFDGTGVVERAVASLRGPR
jgi:tetratricopeptide (TPR) repeat protein